MLAIETKQGPGLSKARPGVDGRYEIDLFAERLARKHAFAALVEPGKQPLEAEERLVQDSARCVLDHVDRLVAVHDRKGKSAELVRVLILARVVLSIEKAVREREGVEEHAVPTLVELAAKEAERIIMTGARGDGLPRRRAS
jgi:hypothetical protein